MWCESPLRHTACPGAENREWETSIVDQATMICKLDYIPGRSAVIATSLGNYVC